MVEDRVERKLAAILAADVVGYGRLMNEDEVGTLARLKTVRRELFEPKTKEHRGRIFKTTGDGALVEFKSAVDAVHSALDIQRTLAEYEAGVAEDRRIRLRIGVSLGDVIVEGNDLYGRGVNVAARMEGLAEPGGICISGNVHEHVRGAAGFVFDDFGNQEVKNIPEPVRAFRVRVGKDRVAESDRPRTGTSPPLPDRPSIAVLPFQNMSGDPEQDYFADGMVEDIITALSRFRGLFVIARNSSFTFKGRSVDIKQVGRDLGVRYVLEGSVRKTSNRVRITGQLIDAGTGAHLWADHFDGALEDVFDLQDQVTERVVCALAPKLQQAEMERAKRKPTENLDAYDYFLRGLDNLHQATRDSVEEALRLFHKAIELDPQFAAAYGQAALCHARGKAERYETDRAQNISESSRLARWAVELGKDDAVALRGAAHALAYVAEDFKTGEYLIDRALSLNPNLAAAWFTSGWLRVWIGEPETAIKHLERFKRMSPLDPFLFMMLTATAFAHIFIGRYDEALAHAERALSEMPNSHQALRAAATSCALAGQIEQAQRVMSRLRQIDPALRISNLKDVTPLQRSQDMAKYVEGMRMAGLPE